MINYRIEVDLSKAPQAARMTAQADDIVGAKLVEIGLIFERTVKINTPLGATKILRGSIFAEPRGNPIREVVLGSTQLYAPIVERGRQPGKWPPPGPIALWVRRVLGAKNDIDLRRKVFLVSRKIAQKGTAGAAMFFKGFNDGRPAAEAVINSIGGTIVAEWETQQ